MVYSASSYYVVLDDSPNTLVIKQSIKGLHYLKEGYNKSDRFFPENKLIPNKLLGVTDLYHRKLISFDRSPFKIFAFSLNALQSKTAS